MRGALLEEQVVTLRTIWSGETIKARRPSDGANFVDRSATSYLMSYDAEMVGPIGPRVERAGGPELMLGGTEQPALRRVARYADAYMTGPVPATVPISGSPDTVVSLYTKVREFAANEGRSAPRLVHGTYVALEASDDEVAARLRDYYDIGGKDRYLWPFSRVLRTNDAIRHHLSEMESVGVDECFLWPTIPDFKQIDLIATAAL